MKPGIQLPATMTIPPEALAELRIVIREEIAEAMATMVSAPTETTTSTGYFTVEQAADYLATSRDRIYELKWQGKIPSYQDGRRPLFKREDLDDWVARDRSAARAEG